MSISWSIVQNALQDWISDATGLTTIWVNQNGPRPDNFATINLEVSPTGRDWADVEDNPNPTPGAEIIYKVRGPRIGVFRIQVFGGPAWGALSAKTLLGIVPGFSQLPSRLSVLSAAGIGIASFGSILDVSSILNKTELESRAALTVRLNLSAEISETGTYFTTVDGTNEIATPDSDFEIDGGI